MKGVWRSPALPAGWTQRPITSKGADMSPGGRWRVTGGPNQRWKAQRWTWGGDDEVGYGNEYETEFEADDFTTVYVWLQIEGACAGQPSDIYADFAGITDLRLSYPNMKPGAARQAAKVRQFSQAYGGTVTGRVHPTFNPTPHQLPSITAAVIDEASVITDQAVDAMRAYCTNGVKFGQGFWVSRTVDPNRPLDSFDRNTLASAIGLAISSN